MRRPEAAKPNGEEPPVAAGVFERGVGPFEYALRLGVPAGGRLSSGTLNELVAIVLVAPALIVSCLRKLMI